MGSCPRRRRKLWQQKCRKRRNKEKTMAQPSSNDELRRVLFYDTVTGVFTWIAPPKTHRFLMGKPVGSLTYQGYIQFSFQGHKDYAHRWAWFYMTGEWPVETVDHRDRNKANNAWLNLRQLEAIGQQCNKDSKNIYRTSNGNPWRVILQRDGRKVNRAFPTFCSAYHARMKAKGELHPEYERNTSGPTC